MIQFIEAAPGLLVTLSDGAAEQFKGVGGRMRGWLRMGLYLSVCLQQQLRDCQVFWLRLRLWGAQFDHDSPSIITAAAWCICFSLRRRARCALMCVWSLRSRT